MKYASEHAGVLTSVHQWKPVPADRFAQLLHHYSTFVADLNGKDALSITAIALDRDATATIYYRRKERGSPVYCPVLMTMEGAGGKTLCFETTNQDSALDPQQPALVIRSAMAARDVYKAERMSEVAQRAAASRSVVAITPRKAAFDEIRRAYERAGGERINLGIHLSTQLDQLRAIKGRIDGVWLHDAGHIGALGEVMDVIAELMGGKGWMGMTGHTPMGWPAPDGLPGERA
jgi:hypothetical protein